MRRLCPIRSQSGCILFQNRTPFVLSPSAELSLQRHHQHPGVHVRHLMTLLTFLFHSPPAPRPLGASPGLGYPHLPGVCTTPARTLISVAVTQHPVSSFSPSCPRSCWSESILRPKGLFSPPPCPYCLSYGPAHSTFSINYS